MMANNKDWDFRDQIQRASVSITNNIAEDYESGFDAKYANFLNIAKGSCSEVRNMLYLCKDRHYCTEEQFIDLKSQAIQISSQLYKLLEYLNNGKKLSANDLRPSTLVSSPLTLAYRLSSFALSLLLIINKK